MLVQSVIVDFNKANVLGLIEFLLCLEFVCKGYYLLCLIY